MSYNADVLPQSFSDRHYVPGSPHIEASITLLWLISSRFHYVLHNKKRYENSITHINTFLLQLKLYTYAFVMGNGITLRIDCTFS